MTPASDANPTRLQRATALVRRTGTAFMADDPFQMAAALGYFSILSMAPLLLVLTGAAGILLETAEVQSALLDEARNLVGPDGADLLATIMHNANGPDGGPLAVLGGFALTLLGATTVFAQLQWALNRIFAAEAHEVGAVGFFKARLTAFAVVLGLGFVLLVSLFVSALITATENMVAGWMPGADLLLQLINLLVSLGILALFIALLFRFVPDRRLPWRPIWLGALVTAILFSVGKFLIGLYLGQASVGSAYGAAGSAIVLMVWVYYASLILFVGAELVQVLARGRRADPADATGETEPGR